MEILLLRQHETVNADAITALSDKVAKLGLEMEVLKNQK